MNFEDIMEMIGEQIAEDPNEAFMPNKRYRFCLKTFEKNCEKVGLSHEDVEWSKPIDGLEIFPHSPIEALVRPNEWSGGRWLRIARRWCVEIEELPN